MFLLLLVGLTPVLSLVPPRPSSCPATSLCVKRCCPEDQVYTFTGPEEVRVDCTDYDKKIVYDPEIDPSFKPREVSLLGDDKFNCSDGRYLVSAELLYGPERYSLTSSGQLRVHLNSTVHEDFNYGDFCVAFTKMNPSAQDFQYDEIRTTYSVCYKIEEEDETVYPVAFFISDVFVFLTLAVYLSLSEFRNNTFGRITIGFLINVFLSFLLIGIHYSLLASKENEETLLGKFDAPLNPGCVFLGYTIQHSLVAVFFWMSAMSIYITRTMQNSFTESKTTDPNKTILLNTAFAQGSALIITFITVIMDIVGNPENNIIPNIGLYNCWLGSADDPEIPFSSTPEFLYFYLIILFVILFNLACFLRTGFSLFSHWWQMRGLAQGSINELFKTQLVTLAKLFVIMGIPWTFDVISVWVKHTYGRSNTYEIRIALNILNLLQGVLIFITLVCRRNVFTAIQNKIQQVKYSPTRDNDTSA